jgi:hypothetical protein
MSYRWQPPSKNFKPLWEGRMLEKIDLGNGLILEIWDYSRKLAGDRWLVGFLAQVGVKPTREDFSSTFYYEQFLQKTDGFLYYRYQKERTFIPEGEVSAIYQSLKENFLKAVLPYITRPGFKDKLIATEVANFEKRVDWELYLQKKEEEEAELEELYKNKEFI